MLTYLRNFKITVQAGTPMTVTGEAFLLSVTGAGRRLLLFICLKISSGVRGWKTLGGFSKQVCFS